MDPDVLLSEIRSKVKFLLEAKPFVGDEELADAGEQLAEKFSNLDEWLTKGGLPPNQWKGNK